jgi:phosphoglycolate phosphatase
MASTLPDLNGWCLAFDLDGTLVETAPDIIGTLNTILGDYNVPAFPFEAARKLVGRGALSLIERGFMAASVPLNAAEAPEMVSRFLSLYRERIADESHVFEGLVTSLDALILAGAKLCVCTNKPTDLSILLLQKLQMLDRFGSVRGADSVPFKKPDPAHLWACVDDLNLSRSKTILIGDSETDYLTAKAANVPCVLVSFGYCDTALSDMSPEALIDNYSELNWAIAKIVG